MQTEVGGHVCSYIKHSEFPVVTRRREGDVPEVCSGHRRAAATSTWPVTCRPARDGGSEEAAARSESSSPRCSPMGGRGRGTQRAPRDKEQRCGLRWKVRYVAPCVTAQHS